ncbi:uncharacterized protein LOC131233929 [Magnolia sinica]|uniref:uncharacterized protein LOC131233929 n=1 Tax=Magnolia sinica TaxID=86752 RepID=UPI00265ABB57|nr:uncharacterized protein LOC131233929 [Magnolia sinica]
MRPKGAGSEWLGDNFSAILEASTSDPSFNVSKSSKEQVPLTKTWHPFNQNASCDRNFIPLNSWMEDRTIFYPSTTKVFSSGHVFGPPARGSSSIDRPIDACNNNIDSSNGKASTVQLHAGHNDGYAGTSGIDNDLKLNGNLLVGSSQMKYDVPLNLKLFPSWRPCLQTDKSELAQWKIQKALNYIPGSAGQCDLAGSPSEAFNQINPPVDFPCWKGAPAPASQHSPFFETDECSVFNQQNQTTPINVDVAEVAFSPKPYGSSLYHETGSVKDAFSSFSSQPPTVVGCMCTERLSTDAYITGSDCSKVGNESRTRNFNGMQESGNNHVLLLDPNPKTFDRMPLSHEEDTIASVTQPALEARVADPRKDFDGAAHDVSSDFFSHASVSTGIARMLGASDSSSEPFLPRLDAQVLVKMIHNLSQLLVSNHYCDENALEECDYEVLQLAIRNLDAWSTKKVGLMRSMLDSNHELGSSYFLSKSTEASKGTALGRSPDTGIEANSIPGADMGFKKDDGMAQAFKKALKESPCEQGEKLAQTLLFKDLWIEAEAALCSMKYELRLARMNIEMEKNKQEAAEDKDSHTTLKVTCKSRDLEKSSSLNANDGSSSHDASLLKPKQSSTENVHDVRQSSCEKSQDMNPSDMNGPKEDDEASVMARFQVLQNLLKIRADNKAVQQQLPDSMIDIGVSMEIQDTEPELHVEHEDHPTKLIDLGSVETRKTQPFLRDQLEDGSLEVTDTVNSAPEIGLGSDALEQPEMTRECDVSDDGIAAQLYTRAWVHTHLPSNACDSPSSDWEHVLKEELPW